MCDHKYKEYLGLNERFDYCEACGQKKSDIESEYVEIRIKNYMELRGGEIMVPRTLTRTGLVALKEKYEKRFETMENKINHELYMALYANRPISDCIYLSTNAYKILLDELGTKADFSGRFHSLLLRTLRGTFNVYPDWTQTIDIRLMRP